MTINTTCVLKLLSIMNTERQACICMLYSL